jgi:hypothetical protein
MTNPLRFREDGTFTIVQFTDLHVQNGEPEDLLTEALMAEVLDAEQPDLVVLTGDVIAGAKCTDPAASWQRAVAPVVEHAVPWAAVFGNHDDEGVLSRADLMELQVGMPYCMSSPGPEDVSGVGNYVLPILASGSDDPAANLYMLDSNAYAETHIAGYGWIRRDQIEWFLRTTAEGRAANGGASLPALAFFHIPLPEYNQIWDMEICYGHKHEPICCPLLNSGFFAALHEAGDVLGTFVGHDHINDFQGELHGIRLCFGRGTGFNTYGREGFLRGARVIRLREGEHNFETWLRLENGELVQEQPRHEPELKRRTCIL